MDRRKALVLGGVVAALAVAAGFVVIRGRSGQALSSPSAAPASEPLAPLYTATEASTQAAPQFRAVLQAGSSGDFDLLHSVMHGKGAPSPAALKARFEPYRNSGIDWQRASAVPGRLIGPPTRDSRGRMIVVFASPQAVAPAIDLIVELVFADEEGEWRFADLSFDTRGNPENKPALPSAEEAKGLARATLALFAEGCAANDFRPLLESMAEPSKRSLTPETLAENYEGWPERAPDAAKLREAEIALGAQPTLDERNLLTVDGMVVGEAKPKGGLRFSLRYFKEGEKWKPIGIQVFPETP